MPRERTWNAGIVLGSMLLAVSGCGDGAAKTGGNAMGVTTALQDLNRALAECQQQAGQCAQDAGADSDALQSCRDALASCREDAGKAASKALAGAITACTDASRQCQQRAGDAGAHMACSDELQACLGANLPNGGDEDGGAEDQHVPSQSPLDGCIDAMHACVLAGRGAEVCAESMQACVLDATPGPDDLGPGGFPDAGAPGGDREPPVDAGTGTTPAEPMDAGRPAEPPATDAGAPGTVDAGACQNAYDACIADGGTHPACNKQLHGCQRASQP